ncbi:hypothetical protein [Flavobacterium sp.]|uniref:hypothetical protein n=1 Tax=Flavobacterium sp. TaxID=239 RepID=UPI002613857F|nr:hypothetical protein [Flavobacterium sp.]
MKNTTIRLGACILFACFNFGAYAQDSFEINDETVARLQYSKVFTIEHKKFPEVNREADFIDYPVPVASLLGKYEIQPTHYRIATSDGFRGKFLADELIVSAEELAQATQSTYLILVRLSDNERFVFRASDIENIRREEQIKRTIAWAQAQGFKPYKDGEDYYIKSKKCDIRLDARTLTELKNDSMYIIKLDADQTKIMELVQQTKVHIKILDSYLGTYRLKRQNTPTATLAAWRKATLNAQKLANKIYSLNKKYDGNYSFSLLNKTNTYDVFLDNLNASKGVLGM